jgi:hypothetical protein
VEGCSEAGRRSFSVARDVLEVLLPAAEVLEHERERFSAA